MRKTTKKVKSKPLDKKVLTFFLIAFPTLMIIVVGIFVRNAWPFQILLALYQFIVLKPFLDDYYGGLASH